jgi:hypothetical protein
VGVSVGWTPLSDHHRHKRQKRDHREDSQHNHNAADQGRGSPRFFAAGAWGAPRAWMVWQALAGYAEMRV